jgi:hypothetical protein
LNQEAAEVFGEDPKEPLEDKPKPINPNGSL